MIAIAFCEREADLAPMTLVLREDGTLAARRRRIDDRIAPTHQEGRFEDLWVHRGSNGRYVRHDLVDDVDAQCACYLYSSWDTGRLWIRPVDEWEEDVGDGPRFVRWPPAGVIGLG